MKQLFIAEKPSVARQFAAVLQVTGQRNGYLESQDRIVTWCVGHLITMSYPEAYDPKLKKWSYDTIPFVPDTYKYEVIPSVRKQFEIVKELLNREDVGTIYVCTDSGREGEYIYRLVDDMAGVGSKKEKRRVWIDSQTEEEILRGVREAKPESEYDNLARSAYLRAEEDYLMGINFSRALTLKYSWPIRQYLGTDHCVIAVGRVMTCVLGMIVRREREIRNFTASPFYRLTAKVGRKPEEADNTTLFEAEWREAEGSIYEKSPKLYRDNGLKEKPDAEQLKEYLENPLPVTLKISEISRKKEKKNPPLLYNLAELQNDCSKKFKINPTETLNIVQELYEKRLVTYPRTDARVLSSAVAKVIDQNIRGLTRYTGGKGILAAAASSILKQGGTRNLGKSRYVNDKLITDHYAIIPTGQGLNQLGQLSEQKQGVYELIVRRFLSIFYPPAEYQKTVIRLTRKTETFVSSQKILTQSGYLKISDPAFFETNQKKAETSQPGTESTEQAGKEAGKAEALAHLRKGTVLSCNGFEVREGKTQPPKRYTSGSLILAMENAGQLIEDDELREQIRGSGIGTSATRDAIISKLVRNQYISLNEKTQVVTPTFLGEIIATVVQGSIRGLLRADLTASWEKGLTGVAEGTISEEEYSAKMKAYVIKYTQFVKKIPNQNGITRVFDTFRPYYRKEEKKRGKEEKEKESAGGNHEHVTSGSGQSKESV